MTSILRFNCVGLYGYINKLYFFYNRQNYTPIFFINFFIARGKTLITGEAPNMKLICSFISFQLTSLFEMHSIATDLLLRNNLKENYQFQLLALTVYK